MATDSDDNETAKGNSSFDEIIGHIEDLLMEHEFQSIQQRFLDTYWSTFEPMDENKLIYTEIFNDYNKTIENYLNKNLKELVPNFSMDDFTNELQKKQPQLDGEVFEVLATFTDFLAFKELILDYRAVQEGKVQDLSNSIVVKSLCN
ncbi:hypothetical protein QAD02_023499 [Eretmocerus hayati]|uniref:Uncharacterized protein n=1 Tax=Eretmocerus hayati TaxID=131215 RepID=A0ACC2Q0X6_9HYME|nr:hypothetical protein QAD02_023499 [Eretmocerus hayati]